MLTAQIAYDRISEGERKQLSSLAAELPGGHGPYNALTAAVWLDDTRTHATSHWHFIDAPYTADGEKFDEPDGDDALRALTRVIATFRDQRASHGSKVKALGVVLHLVGDLHQPLHCCDRNDRGGNDAVLHGVPGERNLHAFWDGAFRFDEKDGKAGALYHELERPNGPGNAEVRKLADALLVTYPPETLPEVGNTDRLAWAKESHKLACLHAYTDLVADGDAKRPARGYVHRAHDDACRRLVAAGVRLALVLHGWLG